MTEILLAFKAGRALRRDGTNFVDADPAKGAIMLTSGDDDLFHFIWKDRTTNENEEDLIVFAGDATFTKVSQSNGRVYVLKFSSSDQRHFFWMQDANSARDEEFAKNLNGLLQDDNYDLEWSINIENTGSAPQASSSSSSSAPLLADSLANIQAIIRSAGSARAAPSAGGAASAPEEDAFMLTDVLTPANLAPLFTNHPELIPTLFPHLPSDLPIPPSAEVLERVVNSTQFKAAAASLDRALRTGLLGGFVRQLGLPEDAGLGVGPFLRAIQEQADRENRGSASNVMDTD